MSMIEKEFIPYNQALELKKLGFDEPCFATYNHDKKLSRNPSHDIGDLPIEGQPYYWQNTKIHISCVAAPLYQQAFSFFRKKGFVINIYSKGNDGEEWYFLIKKGTISTSDIIYKTYEEAELACLKKLIELVDVVI